MVLNVHLLRYLWKVRGELPGNRRQKKQILSRVESSVRDFVTENPNADYAAIEQRFGTPQQIAASCIEEMDAQELTLQLRIRKTIVRIVAATALVLVLLWAGVVVTALIRHVKAMNGYLIVGEAEVIDRTEYTEGK
jgi:Fe2+ transport system protein B